MLVGRASPFGPVLRRLPPVFRDRDELPASSDLGQELHNALAAARFLIVLCSPRAAASNWVNKEIIAFKRERGEGRVLAVILSGEPFAGDGEECFPPALRFRLAADGTVSDMRSEPIAADIRRGKDGRRLALLKLIAGITGLPLDALVRRDLARRQRRLGFVTAGSLTVTLITIGLAIYADAQRRVAEHQRLLTEKSLDFLTGTFAVANPATENPRTITALTILDRASKRVATELRDEPDVSARLLGTTGQIYLGLGLPKEAERDLHKALALSSPKSETRVRILLRLAEDAAGRTDAKASRAFVDAADAEIDPRADYAPAFKAEVAERRAKALFLAGNFAQAAKDLDRAAMLYQALPGDHRKELGRVWTSQGIALSNLGDNAATDAAFARAEALYLAKYGPSHLLTANVMQNRAAGALGSGRLDEAEQKITQATRIYDKVLEPDHPNIAAAMILLGRIRTARQDEPGALAAFDRARTIETRLYGADNPAVGDVDFYAAQAESDRGHIDAALRLLGKTKRIYDLAYGQNDPDQVELLTARMKVYEDAGQIAKSEAECTAAVALQRRLDKLNPYIAALQQTCERLSRGVHKVVVNP